PAAGLTFVVGLPAARACVVGASGAEVRRQHDFSRTSEGSLAVPIVAAMRRRTTDWPAHRVTDASSAAIAASEPCHHALPAAPPRAALAAAAFAAPSPTALGSSENAAAWPPALRVRRTVAVSTARHWLAGWSALRNGAIGKLAAVHVRTA